MASEEDKRKRKRKISNRESARRSRMRKQQHIEYLEIEAARLMKENGEIVERIGELSRGLAGLGADNAAMSAVAAELAGRLRSMEDLGGSPAIFEPWQPFCILPPPASAIMAAAEIFEC